MYERLREAIKEQGLTVNKFAKTVNIASQDFYNALNGKKRFFPKWRKNIAGALNMSESELFEE